MTGFVVLTPNKRIFNMVRTALITIASLATIIATGVAHAKDSAQEKMKATITSLNKRAGLIVQCDDYQKGTVACAVNDGKTVFMVAGVDASSVEVKTTNDSRDIFAMVMCETTFPNKDLKGAYVVNRDGFAMVTCTSSAQTIKDALRAK